MTSYINLDIAPTHRFAVPKFSGGKGPVRSLTASMFHCVRNATKFREVHRAKRLALREAERSLTIRFAADRVWESREPVRRRRRSASGVKPTAKKGGPGDLVAGAGKEGIAC